MSQRQLCVHSRLLPYLSWSPNLKFTWGFTTLLVCTESPQLFPRRQTWSLSPHLEHTHASHCLLNPPSVFLSTSGLSHALFYLPGFSFRGGEKSQHLRRFEIISFRRACVAKFCANCWGYMTNSVLPSREQEKDLWGRAGPEHMPWLKHSRARITRQEAGEEGLAQKRH